MARPTTFAIAALVALHSFAMPISPTLAQQRVVPPSRPAVQYSYAPIVQKVAPAVVNVYASRTQKLARNPLFDDPFFQQFFGRDMNGLGRERVQKSLGSGVIVDPSGLVVTNHHVIEGMTDVKVALADKREFEAEILLRDPRSDLAVLRLKGASERFPVLEFGDSDNLQVGDLVLALGNPFGVGQTVTQGIVSALARTQIDSSDYQFFIQTDASINPGNSGGALVDLDGRLEGINTAIYSRSGGSVGIGFAIPVNMVRIVVDSAKAGGKSVRRPWLGAKLQTVTSDIAEGLGLVRPIGALVVSVTDGSPAAEAGIKRGDIILSVDGQAIDDPDAFGFRFGTRGLGQTASVGLRRGTANLTLPIKLRTAPETPAREVAKIDGANPLAGATIENLSPAVGEELSVDISSSGVVIAEVDENSNAGQAGFQKGDIIVEVNGAKIGTSREAQRALADKARLWKIVINRGGQLLATVFQG
ncbi:Do/DeqQ family serine protease [Rhizobiales bacterium GAS191]|jgi:Do/DeqQ family serine protease|nr:Do/DeqQ family serine protease [Rhizobiales bacterium GAS191]SEE52796.1 Do/DeqQ family serine protease [Rhizobiales bacterium GAS188]